MMIGLCELNLGGCYEGERSEPTPALILSQGVEQNLQRVIRNSTNDGTGILSHSFLGKASLAAASRHSMCHPEKSLELGSTSIRESNGADEGPEPGGQGSAVGVE